jgi:hypothetical protein
LNSCAEDVRETFALPPAAIDVTGGSFAPVVPAADEGTSHSDKRDPDLN